MTSTMNDESSQVEPTQSSSHSSIHIAAESSDQAAPKRKLSDTDPSQIPTKIPANDLSLDEATLNKNTRENNTNEDELLNGLGVDDVDELDDASKKKLLEQTTEQLKKSLCLKKLKQLSDAREKCIDNLGEQYFLENDLNYLNYDKWKKSNDMSSSEQQDFVANGFSNQDELFNMEKFISAKLNTPLPLLEQTNRASLVPKRAAQPAQSTSSANLSNKTIAERAKHEAQILQRIAQLRKDGLWSIKRLPKLVEPQRPKTHWDYLLDEMTWMSTDFQQERRWKKSCSRKLAAAIQKHFKERELKAELAEKEEEKRLRKQASLVARDIMQFWRNVEKIIEYKQRTLMEEKRKHSLDARLNFIVDQTEKYSSWLIESLTANVSASRAGSAVETMSQTSGDRKMADDGDYEDAEEASEDDESTIETEEKMMKEDKGGGGSDVDDEIRRLQMESEIPLDDLLRDYKIDENYFGKEETGKSNRASRLARREAATSRMDVDEESEDEEEEDEEEDEDEEYSDDEEEEQDDEETIEAEEKMMMDGDKYDAEGELAALKADNSVSIEELLGAASSANVEQIAANLEEPKARTGGQIFFVGIFLFLIGFMH